MTDDVAAPEGSGDWYHTLTFPDGRRTPGLFDHDPVLGEYHLPDRLDGKRVLDVGTFDGYWAFEFERRGAEVVALDIPDKTKMDWPAPLRRTKEWEKHANYKNFESAHEAYESSVVRERASVYDVSTEQLGTFDLVFVGSLLLHLRDPVLALERLRAVCHDRLQVVDCVDPMLDRFGRWFSGARFQAGDGRMEWWVPNRRCLGQMVEAAGYVDVSVGRRFTIPFRATRGGVAHASVTARNPSALAD